LNRPLRARLLTAEAGYAFVVIDNHLAVGLADGSGWADFQTTATECAFGKLNRGEGSKVSLQSPLEPMGDVPGHG